MRFSQVLAPTLREVPAEAEIPSHRLMLRAALMRKSSAGIYTYLPLGYAVLKKIMRIIREEMDRAGSQELLLPILQPSELWLRTGRWNEYGEEMFRLEDRHGRSFCLGPTHEEIITDLVRQEVRSYRQLPLVLYQIQNKYRDEIRPRFGVMRGREFIMKDAYSFDRDTEGLERSYRSMYKAYERIFARCGLKTRAVLADPGAIGGNDTHEFMVLTQVGEAEVVYCNSCDYAANVEKAEASPAETVAGQGARTPAIAVKSTPGVRTIEELRKFLGIGPESMIKTLVYLADSQPVVALVRGDRELNEVKLGRFLGATRVESAPPEVVEAVTGAPVGFAGPVGLKGVRLVADLEVPHIPSGVTGANQADAHYVNVVYGRDYTADAVADIRRVAAGDRCPACGGELLGARGVEVGQVFKLGTKYSDALGARFLDEDGNERPCVMGCYGIGVTRTMAAVIEQHHDDDGIIWPMSVAPCHVDVIVINPNDPAQMAAAEKLYDDLTAQGVDVILDERDERPGVKFKDADLIGFPLRAVIGPKSLAQGVAEVRFRATGEVHILPLEEAAGFIGDAVRARLDGESQLAEE